MQINLYDLLDYARLDNVYNKMRVLQAKHNLLETTCIGSGKCCKVALKVPLVECANIAYNLKRTYYLKMEDDSANEADLWWAELIAKLKDAFNDTMYKPESGDTDRHCAFYNNGCTIYESRPLVCRGYGVIFTVDSFCPRKRLANGDVELFKGEQVRNIVQEFIDIYKGFGERYPDYNFSVFLPLGVLHFLLSAEEMQELKDTTEDRFWQAVPEYTMAWIRMIMEDIRIEQIINEE